MITQNSGYYLIYLHIINSIYIGTYRLMPHYISMLPIWCMFIYSIYVFFKIIYADVILLIPTVIK